MLKLYRCMFIIPNQSEIIVLFDEFGTPSFKDINTNNYFMGVSALYELDKEEDILNALDQSMGLSKSKPLKNDKIGKQRAITISNAAGKQDLHVTVGYLDLSDSELRQSIDTYLKFCDKSREKYRGIMKKRKETHFFHSQLSNHCLFDVIINYLINNSGKYHFNIFIDDWIYPESDRDIALEYTPKKLQQRLRDYLIKNLNQDARILIDTIQTLKTDSSKRKRFIDALTSICSRTFIDKKNLKYDPQALDILKNKLKNKIKVENLTKETIQLVAELSHDN